MSFSKLAIAIEILNLARLFLFPLSFKSSKLASSCLLNCAAKREDNSPGNSLNDISKPESSANTIKLVKEAMPCAFKWRFLWEVLPFSITSFNI